MLLLLRMTLAAACAAAATALAAVPPPAAPSSRLAPGLSHEALAAEAVAWAVSNGLAVADATMTDDTFVSTHGPLTHLPTVFPASAFQAAVDLAPVFGRLTASVLRDPEWLSDTLRPTLASDAFTARLHAIFEATGRGVGQPYLAVLRSDYMLDAPSGRLLQIELNTIASSFAGMSAKTAALHQCVGRAAPPLLRPRAPADTTTLLLLHSSSSSSSS